jgi:hypothetical protein
MTAPRMKGAMLSFKVAAQAAMSLVILAAVTVILLHVKAKPIYSEHLVYIYICFLSFW